MTESIEKEVRAWVVEQMSLDVEVEFIKYFHSSDKAKERLYYLAVLNPLQHHSNPSMYVTPNTLPFVINRYYESREGLVNVRAVSEGMGDLYLKAKRHTSPLDNLTLHQFITAASQGLHYPHL